MEFENNIDLIHEIQHLRNSLQDVTTSINVPILEKEFKLLFENLSSGFSYHDVIFDSNGKAIDCVYLAVNKAFEDIIGFKREEILGKTFTEIQKGEVEKFWMDIYGKVAKTGKTVIFDEYSKLINKHLEIIAYSPQHGKFVTIFSDITNKKKQEIALNKQVLINKTLTTIAKKLLSSTNTIETISNYILRKTTAITNCEYGFISLFHKGKNNYCTSCSLINTSKSIRSNVIFEDDSKNNKCILNYLSNSRKSNISNFKHFSAFHCEKNSIEIDIKNFISTPIFVHEKLVGQIVMANSITDFNDEDLDNIEKIADIFALAILRKETENELLKAKQKAEEADKLKTTFLENMSHEIRTPMNGIIGFANLLKDNHLDSIQREEYISYIDNSCNVLTKIIDDIIDISKIEIGQLSIFKTSFSLSKLMNEVETRFNEERIRKNKNDLQIIYKNDKNLNYQIHTDQTRLSQIFYNLMGNAMKFTQNGSIEFGYNVVETLHARSLRFYVKDSGIGIPIEKQEIIFERFRQVDESQNRTFGGSGLGLAISKHLVELLGGSIGVESTPNEGTTFYFEIPNIIEKIIDDEIMISNETIYPNWENKKILIVEDNAINFRLLKEIFNKTNAQILWADEGLKSIEMFKNETNIDIVLMDIVLPDISGYEAFKEIRKINNKIPILAQTALAMLEEKEKIEKTGFDGYIIKPIKSVQLFEEMTKILDF